MPATTFAPINPLAEAEHLLRTDGWVVGSFKCASGARCAVGALRAACGMREVTGVTRFRNKAYQQSLLLLAASIDKRFKTSMEFLIRGETHTWGGDPAPTFDSLSRQQQITVLEEFVWEYNDDRSDDAKGRNAVLRKFRSAAQRFVTG